MLDNNAKDQITKMSSNGIHQSSRPQGWTGTQNIQARTIWQDFILPKSNPLISFEVESWMPNDARPYTLHLPKDEVIQICEQSSKAFHGRCMQVESNFTKFNVIPELISRPVEDLNKKESTKIGIYFNPITKQLLKRMRFFSKWRRSMIKS